MKRIAKTPLISYSVDLWGLSQGWVETIQDKFLTACPSGMAETYNCPANASCQAYLTEEEAKEVDKVMIPLLNLAR